MIEQQEVLNTSFLQDKVFEKLNHLTNGKITVIDGVEYDFGADNAERTASINIHNKSFYKKIALRGAIGAAESYMDGDWTSNNLLNLLIIMLDNQQTLMRLEKGAAVFRKLQSVIKNTIYYGHIKRCKQNILYHYDLSNDFFEIFLDPLMQYSSAVYTSDAATLEEAQINKLRQIATKLDIKTNDHILEIGSGWGGLAIYLAEHYRCKVTTITISDEQHAYAKNLIANKGLSDRIKILNQDYRTMTGKFDKIVSVEMIESIGYQYFQNFFNTCNKLLKPNGKLVLQCITINDQEYDRYKRETDFIKAYVFPGGCLPSINEISKCTKNGTQMNIDSITDIGISYAKTLNEWRNRFMHSIDKIKSLGFEARFIRMFEYYFCYCEAGFLKRYISVKHIVLNKRS